MATAPAEILPPDERFNRARCVGRAQINLLNARDMLREGLAVQAEREVSAALDALGSEWPL